MKFNNKNIINSRYNGKIIVKMYYNGKIIFLSNKKYTSLLNSGIWDNTKFWNNDDLFKN